MKKIVCVIMAILLVAMTFTACGAPAATSSAPVTEAPATEAPATEAPKTEAPATEAPATDAPAAGDFAATLAGKGEGLKVGLTMADMASTYIVGAANYFKRLMETAGAEVTVVNCEGDANAQSDQIDDFVNMGCDIIAIHAADAEALAPAVERATKAGVPCVGFNKEISGGNLKFAVVSSDNVATGASAAQWLADKAKEEGVSNPKIAVMQGTMTQSDAYLRQDGIDSVAKAEGLTIIENPCDWGSDQAEAALNDVITANPDLYGIITHCDSMDPGVISALNQNQMNGAAGDDNHIYWSGIDCDATGIDALNSGLMDVCVEQNPLELATVITKGCLEIVAKGGTLDGEVIPMNTVVVDKSMTGDPARWATYDPETAPELWDGTERTWNNFLK